MMRRRCRAVRLLGATVVAVALVTAVGAGDGAGPVAVAAPAAPPPGEPAPVCTPGEGIEITADMVAAVQRSDDHDAATPAGASVSAGCAHQHQENDLGWSGSAPDTPQDAAADEDDNNDPFAPRGGDLYYYVYQFDDFSGGLPDYWEPPTALQISDWPFQGDRIRYRWHDPATGQTKTASLPLGADCHDRGPVPATAAPGRVASYRAAGHPKIYLYDHVPLARAARRFRDAGGSWYHYLCGPNTPSGIAGPGGRLSATEADYYSTPHWIYVRGYTLPQVDQLTPVWRVARTQTEVYDAVRTSPAARSVVGLKVWMWGPPAGYDIELGNLRARVEPAGIVVRAPDVPLTAHDLRSGGCGDGGTPDVGDSTAESSCYFTFDRATRPDEVYTVGFALRWRVTTRTAGGAQVGPPMTFWTTSVRQFQVGEVQVPVN